MADLLPCPLCGKECNVAHIGPGYRSVTCTSVTCTYGAAATSEGAIAAHNRIASLATLGAEVVEAADWPHEVYVMRVGDALRRHRSRAASAAGKEG